MQYLITYRTEHNGLVNALMCNDIEDTYKNLSDIIDNIDPYDIRLYRFEYGAIAEEARFFYSRKHKHLIIFKGDTQLILDQN